MQPGTEATPPGSGVDPQEDGSLAGKAQGADPLEYGELQRQVRELEARQSELLLQISELEATRGELAESRDSYADLYATLEQRVEDQSGKMHLLAEAISNLGEGILITSDGLNWPGPEIVFVNEAMCRITGYKAEELIGQTPRLLQGEETDLEVLADLRRRLSSGQSCLLELTNYRKDGSPYEAELFITPLIDSNGQHTNFVSIHRDITERKRAERELRETNQELGQNIDKLRMTQDAARIGLWEWDLVSQELNWDATQRELFGLDPEAQITRESFFSVIHPDDLPELEQALIEVIENHASYDAEFRIIRTDGSIRWFAGKGDVIRDESGDPLRMVGINYDITSRKQAELALREREAELEAILASLTAGIAVLDSHGTIVTVNPAWDEISTENGGLGGRCGVGGDYLEACRRSITEDSELAEEVVEGLQAVVNGTAEEFTIEYPCHSPGRQRWFFLQANSMLGETGGAIVSHTDISARKVAEDAVSRERDFNEKIIGTAKTVVLVLDREGRVVRFNPFFERLSGWTLEDAEGRNWIETFLPRRNRKRVSEIFFSVLKGTPSGGSIYPVITREGDERIIEWYDAPLTDDEGELVGILWTGTDVTDQRELEREVINASEEERLRTAHDLHDGVASLLAGIDYRAEALAQELNRLNIAQGEEVRTISSLIRDAIAQTRAISRGLHPVGQHPEDLMGALGGLSSQVNALSNMTCQFRCPRPVPVEDPQRSNQLFRIAQEAVNNALKHSNASHVTISLTPVDEELVLGILDDGVGVDPDASKSGGLGLHIMEYRARAINGSLNIRRRKNGGTRVTCTVPLSG